MDVIRDEHVKAARKAVVNSEEILKDLEEEIERDCEGLRSFLYATSVRSPFLWTRLQDYTDWQAILRSLTRSLHAQEIVSLALVKNWAVRSSQQLYEIV